MNRKIALLVCLAWLKVCLSVWGGDMYVLGWNAFGQLGDGRPTTTAELILVAEDVVDVSMGESHSLFIKRDGSLWGMGDNEYGQLGFNPIELKTVSYPVGIGYNMESVSAGGNHTLVINKLGQLLATGYNRDGQLGVELGTDQSEFERVAVGALAVSAGARHSLFIKPDQTLWGMGSNRYGELGQPDIEELVVPTLIDEGVIKISAGRSHSLYLKENGEVWGMGWGSNLGIADTTTVDVPTLLFTDAIDIAAGLHNSVVVRVDGTLWGVGRNTNGSLGVGDEDPREGWTYVTNRVKQVFAAGNNTYVIDEDDSLWGMGEGRYGTLGSDRNLSESLPTKISDSVQKVAGKSDSVLVLKRDGTLWALGRNENGQLGVQLGVNRSDPYLLTSEVEEVKGGGTFGFFAKEDGGLWGMGYNGTGALGFPNKGAFAEPTFLDSAVKAIDAGRDHSLLLTKEGVLKTSGLNDEGQLGDGTFTDRNLFVTVDTEVAAVSAGRMHSLYLKEDGRLFGMGQNKYGQLGQGDTTARTVPVFIADNVVAMAAGGVHSLFITNDGELYGCGSNGNGELGLGDVEESLEPVLIAEDVLSVSAGYYHTVYVTEDHGLWGMGANINFALALSDLNDVRIPVKLASSVKAVAAGWLHTLVLDLANNLYGAGYNFFGELASKSEDEPGWVKIASSVSAFDAGAYTTYYVVSDFWNGWAVRSTGDVQTETGFSWMNVGKDPWIWVYSLGRYAYLLPQVERNSGNWLYLPGNDGTNLRESWNALDPDLEGDVLWEDVLGWVNVSRAPWLYSYILKTYLYINEDLLGETGVWVYSQAGVKNPMSEEGGALFAMPMAKIPAGSFQMGDTFSEGWDEELPVHTVELSAYWIGETEVTWGQWQEVRDWAVANGYTDLDGVGVGRGEEYPVYIVSWYDVVKWCNAASERMGLEPVYYLSDGGAVYRTGFPDRDWAVWPFIDYSKNGYRLPTEAEWERAARGGLEGKRFPWGDTISHAEANYSANGSAFSYDVSEYTTFTYHPNYDEGGNGTSPVKSFAANGLGLYGMAGNLAEWCGDWYGLVYDNSPSTDPVGAGPEYGARVIRGGSWYYSAFWCRVACRYASSPFERGFYIGFRVTRNASGSDIKPAN